MREIGERQKGRENEEQENGREGKRQREYQIFNFSFLRKVTYRFAFGTTVIKRSYIFCERDKPTLFIMKSIKQKAAYAF